MTELRELADGRADLLAEVAGILEGAREGELDEPLACRPQALQQDRGRPEAIPAWIAEGRRRRAAGRRPPFSGGLHGGGQGLPQKSRASHGIAPVAFPQDGQGATAENPPCLLPWLSISARTRGDHEPASGLPDLCTASPGGASTWLG